MMNKIIAEFIGTFLLLAAIVGSGIMGETISGGNTGVALLINTVSTGAALYVLITVIGPISGAHINPLVSAKCLMEKTMTAKLFSAYVLAQVAGAVLGVIFAHLMFDAPLVQMGVKDRSGTGILVAEFLATFGLIATIVLGERFCKDKIATLVAFYITSAFLFTASTSFANPAVTLARSLTATFAGITRESAVGFFVVQVLGLIAAMALLGNRDTASGKQKK
ncbi:MAG: aquaporin family protein [Alphaproteobacteria bacterium]|nr:aquaporin family protein [Alphaproteobacteria bacterium]